MDILQNGVRLEQLEAQIGPDRVAGYQRKTLLAFRHVRDRGVRIDEARGRQELPQRFGLLGRTVEPLPGVFYPDRSELVQFGRGGAEALRAYGRREGFLLLNGLNYGENWLGGDWVGEPRHFLYSYDRYFDYCLRILDRFSGKGEAFYQFWNEPDNFWRPAFDSPNSANGREHFTLVQQHVWSIVKARDKNALAIADGEVNDTRVMDEFADLWRRQF